MLEDKHKIEKEQNAQLRNQVAQLLQSEQEQKLQMQQYDSTIQTLQVGFRSKFIISCVFLCSYACMHAYTYIEKKEERKIENDKGGLNL